MWRHPRQVTYHRRPYIFGWLDTTLDLLLLVASGTLHASRSVASQRQHRKPFLWVWAIFRVCRHNKRIPAAATNAKDKTSTIKKIKKSQRHKDCFRCCDENDNRKRMANDTLSVGGAFDNANFRRDLRTKHECTFDMRTTWTGQYTNSALWHIEQPTKSAKAAPFVTIIRVAHTVWRLYSHKSSPPISIITKTHYSNGGWVCWWCCIHWLFFMFVGCLSVGPIWCLLLQMNLFKI